MAKVHEELDLFWNRNTCIIEIDCALHHVKHFVEALSNIGGPHCAIANCVLVKLKVEMDEVSH